MILLSYQKKCVLLETSPLEVVMMTFFETKLKS